MQLWAFGVEFRVSAQLSYVMLTAENKETYGKYTKSKEENRGHWSKLGFTLPGSQGSYG